jgi:hypothetical protein
MLKLEALRQAQLHQLRRHRALEQMYCGEGTSYLDSLTDAPCSVFTSDSPLRTMGLTRSCAVRTRRDAARLLNYSLSYLSGAESSSDRDNGSGHTPSRSYSQRMVSDEGKDTVHDVGG